MPIHFRCPHCDKLLAIGTRKGGAQIHCPMCDRVVTVPPRTEVQLPTHTVVPPDVGQAWWVDAPPPAEAPKSEPTAEPPPSAPADAWWLTAPASPPSPATAAPLPRPEAIEPPPASAPEPSPNPLVFETPTTTSSLAANKAIAPVRSFPISLFFFLAGIAVLAAGGVMILLLSQPTPPSSEATPVPSNPTKNAEHSDEKISALPASPNQVAAKNRRSATEEELLGEAATFPEVSLDRGNERTEAQRLRLQAVTAAREGKPLDMGSQRIGLRPDLTGLPLRTGDECRLSADAAHRLQDASLALRAQLFAATQAGATRPDAKKLRAALNADDAPSAKWSRPESIPALQQLLPTEDAALREVLVDRLARISGPAAGAALVRIALYDLSAEVRKQALLALAKRPHDEYRQALLDGFRYPWPVVAERAAEALVALKRRDTIPELVNVLDLPDPNSPYKKPGKDEMYVREVVRINHLHNCLLCHAPSLNESDKLRGFVPSPDQAPPPSFSREYYSNRRPGLFVRADVTYLRPDFSIPLRVDNPGKWPKVQRFDFLVRERPATMAESKAVRSAEASPYRNALFFALRELTGADAGSTVADWKRWAKRSP